MLIGVQEEEQIKYKVKGVVPKISMDVHHILSHLDTVVVLATPKVPKSQLKIV